MDLVHGCGSFGVHFADYCCFFEGTCDGQSHENEEVQRIEELELHGFDGLGDQSGFDGSGITAKGDGN